MDKQLPELERGREGGRGRSGEEGAASREEGQGALTTSDYWAREEGRRDHCGVPACGCAHTHARVCRRGSVPASAIWLLDRALLINREVNCCGRAQPVSNITPGTWRQQTSYMFAATQNTHTHTRACFSGLRRQEPSSYFFNVEMINCVNRTLKHH